jgi:peptide/nickel transport system permease protein
MSASSSVSDDRAEVVLTADVSRRHRRGALAVILSTWSGRIGLTGTLLILGIACAGPFFGGSPTRISGAMPFSSPTWRQPLGTDLLSRSVFDRVLHGGVRLIIIVALATVVAYVIGASLGLLAGYRQGVVDEGVMRALDVLLAFPPILLLLLLAASAGQGLAPVFIGLVLVNIPGVARVVRSAVQELVGRAYVEAAVLRGERTVVILAREILPNIRGTILADAGPRMSGTIIIFAGLNYLGIGVNPPTPDWGAMIFENRAGLGLQPWAVVAPALLIVLLVVSLNLLADAYARGIGRSDVTHGPSA